MKTPSATGRNERISVLFLCLLAAIHVFVFAAAFPFFSVVDETAHFDLTVRYSHEDIPRSLPPPGDEALLFMVVFGTPEFLWPASALPGHEMPPPPWKQPMEKIRANLESRVTAYKTQYQNYEAASPPLYYELAGGWWRLGKILGLTAGELLYWLRFLDVPLVVLLVWLGWLATRYLFPENLFVRLAVPALIAFLPQPALYTINNDILSPLTFGAAFALLLKLFDAEKPSLLLAIAAGLCLAATFLTKMTNLPLLAVAGVFILFKMYCLARRGLVREWLVPLLLLVLVAGIPMAGWMAWCKSVFGDFTGSGPKIKFLNWTNNPPSLWLAHPIFTSHGLWYFLKQNLSTFWQGEMLWHGQPMTNPRVDLTYVVLTFGAFVFVLAGLLRRRPQFNAPQQTALWLGFLCIGAAFAFFAVLSVKYDFQDCYYPSRKLPFFVSGRLMLGMLVPFLILFACSLDLLMKRFGNVTKFFMLFALLGFMLAAEITIDRPVFGNDYNWFHL